MLDALKSVPGLIRDWRSQGDGLYQGIGCFAGWLVVAVHEQHQRPSDILAQVMAVAGVTPAVRWLQSGLPPFLVRVDVPTGRFLTTAIAFSLLLMVVVPLLDARRDEIEVLGAARGLLGCRAAATVWILLVLVAQIGFLSDALDQLTDWGLALFATLCVAGVAALCCWLSIRNSGIAGAFDPVWAALREIALGLANALLMTAVALLFTVAMPVISVAGWLLATEADSHRHVQEERRRRDLERFRRNLPQGALIPVDLTSSRESTD